MRHFAIVFAAACLALILPYAASTKAGEAQRGATLLTVTGKIGTTNRGASDAFHDAFITFQGKSFDKAYVFDRAMLEVLEQKSVVAQAEGWPGPVNLQGPLLKDILKAAGAQSTTVTVSALDGYNVVISQDELASREWVLAVSANGQPLGIGGRGPAWLVYDTSGSGPASEEKEAFWVWSAFHIHVE